MLEISYKWNGSIRHLSFCVWLLSLSISRSIHSVACITTTFLFMTEIISYHIYHNLFIHSSADEYLGCFHLLAFVNSVALMHVHVFIWIPVFNSPGYIQRMELLGYIVIVCLTLWGTTISTADAPFSIHTSNIWGSQFFCILTNAYCFPFILSHPSGWVWSGTSLWFWFPFP